MIDHRLKMNHWRRMPPVLNQNVIWFIEMECFAESTISNVALTEKIYDYFDKRIGATVMREKRRAPGFTFRPGMIMRKLDEDQLAARLHFETWVAGYKEKVANVIFSDESRFCLRADHMWRHDRRVCSNNWPQGKGDYRNQSWIKDSSSKFRMEWDRGGADGGFGNVRYLRRKMGTKLWVKWWGVNYEKFKGVTNNAWIINGHPWKINGSPWIWFPFSAFSLC